MLAIGFMRDVVAAELATGPGTVDSSRDMGIAYFKAYLPEKWFDEQTSDKSWDQVWEEMNIQLEIIFDALNGEAMRIARDNTGFRYLVVKGTRLAALHKR